MIANDSQIARARENLASMEAAIESLRKELLPNHERNFRLYAQPWIDFRDQFQADIDDYLARRTRPAGDPAVPPETTDATPPART